MAKIITTFSVDALSNLSNNQATIDSLAGQNKENSAKVRETKLHSYAVAVADTLGTALTQKKNFPTAFSSELKEDLMVHCGVKESMAAKFVKNLAKARAHVYGPQAKAGSNLSPEAVLADFADAGINSENDIIKLDKVNKPFVEQMVELLAGVEKKDKSGFKGGKVESHIRQSGGDITVAAKHAVYQDIIDGLLDAMREEAAMAVGAKSAGEEASLTNGKVNEVFDAIGV